MWQGPLNNLYVPTGSTRCEAARRTAKVDAGWLLAVTPHLSISAAEASVHSRTEVSNGRSAPTTIQAKRLLETTLRAEDERLLAAMYVGRVRRQTAQPLNYQCDSLAFGVMGQGHGREMKARHAQRMNPLQPSKRQVAPH